MAAVSSLMDVGANLERIRARIAAAGGDPDKVTVIAVTKGFGAEAIDAALGAGLHELGENYAQELLTKAGARPAAPLHWHFLGAVQRNKVPALAPLVSLWHAIDRIAAGEAIARRRPDARVLVQVNVSDEPGKHGCRFDEAPELVKGLQSLGLDVPGLMAVGPAGDPERARPGFRALARLADQLGLGELSIGMTEDLEVAIQEGATMVRIGRGLFGPRSRHPRLRG
jgi:PLP dependent protein